MQKNTEVKASQTLILIVSGFTIVAGTHADSHIIQFRTFFSTIRKCKLTLISVHTSANQGSAGKVKKTVTSAGVRLLFLLWHH